jgi:hypothetical protein
MPLDEADITQIAELLKSKMDEFGTSIDDKLNKAITKRLTAAEQKILDQQTKAFESFKPKTVETPAGETPPKDDIRYKTLEAMVKESNAKVEEAERRAKAAQEKNRESGKRAKAAELLQKAGLTGARLDIGVGHLVDSMHALQWEGEDEDSQRLVWSQGADSIELNTGFNQWLKTDHAKEILPPKGTRGSGSSPGNGGGSSAAKTKDDLLWESLGEALRKQG